ncbi:MAG: APC family permease, partial [Acidobacteria bacterium]|nr:APC family permease [Acidobacteriota bacterium]
TPLAVITVTIPAALALAALGNWGEWETGYFTVASQRIGGAPLGYAMLAASVIATAALSISTILSTTRIPFAMAEDGYLPKWLAAVHPKYGTPARAIAFSTVVYCALAATDVVNLVNIYIPLRIATTILMLLAAWRLRKKMPNAVRTFSIPGGKLGLAGVVILPIVFCAVKLWYSDAYVLYWSPVLLASGPVAFVALRWLGKK